MRMDLLAIARLFHPRSGSARSVEVLFCAVCATRRASAHTQRTGGAAPRRPRSACHTTRICAARYYCGESDEKSPCSSYIWRVCARVSAGGGAGVCRGGGRTSAFVRDVLGLAKQPNPRQVSINKQNKLHAHRIAAGRDTARGPVAAAPAPTREREEDSFIVSERGRRPMRVPCCVVEGTAGVLCLQSPIEIESFGVRGVCVCLPAWGGNRKLATRFSRVPGSMRGQRVAERAL